MKEFDIKDCEVLIINRGDRCFCVDARCTHAGAPLSEGSLEGEVLTCPWHGSQFRISDGSVLRGPAENALKTYAVVVKDNWVFVEV
jgi:nitrite reductase/ring-hydroxylating ferredoxin subunit